MLRQLFEVLVLPPASALLLLLIGCALRRWRPRMGRGFQVAAVAWIWLASTPCFGGLLLGTLQSAPALPAEGRLPRADAIVVLAAGADRVGGEYGGPVIGPITMQRLRYAAALHRRTGLPLLCSGGAPSSGAPSLAAMMKQTAERELGVSVRWIEERSANTLENLRFSAQLLAESGLSRIFLVTSAWHMPRSVAAAARFGLEPAPAPTGFRGEVFASWRSFAPHWSGLRDTCLAMHEWGGRVVYALTP
ncbi:MAG: YdcF family protein [Planctomycetota bacterium]|nr:YdcF family protein [Planctomycetota bacterium]